MSKTGRPRNTMGSVYQRAGSAVWWMRYRDAAGAIQKESTGETDRESAERILRSRLDERDEGRLPIILANKSLTFNDWADWFLDKRSKPPFRAEKTPFGEPKRAEVSAPSLRGSTTIADHTRSNRAVYRAAFVLRKEDTHQTRLGSSGPAQTRHGASGIPDFAADSQRGGKQEAALGESVQRSRISGSGWPSNAQAALHDRQRTRADRIVRTEPPEECHLHHREMGLRPYKELMRMRKSQVDFENRLVHIPDSKTPTGEGDMPMTAAAR